MELSLIRQEGTQVAVSCDGQPSHTFDLHPLIPDDTRPDRPPHPLEDPVTYGQAARRCSRPSPWRGSGWPP